MKSSIEIKDEIHNSEILSREGFVAITLNNAVKCRDMDSYKLLLKFAEHMATIRKTVIVENGVIQVGYGVHELIAFSSPEELDAIAAPLQCVNVSKTALFDAEPLLEMNDYVYLS